MPVVHHSELTAFILPLNIRLLLDSHAHIVSVCNKSEDLTTKLFGVCEPPAQLAKTASPMLSMCRQEFADMQSPMVEKTDQSHRFSERVTHVGQCQDKRWIGIRTRRRQGGDEQRVGDVIPVKPLPVVRTAICYPREVRIPALLSLLETNLGVPRAVR